VGVETLRASGLAVELGEVFWDWGIPTAASLCQLSGLPLEPIATGGIAHGLDVARALVLGASAVGIARPFLQAWTEGGEAGIDARIDALVAGLKVAMLLTGSRSIDALRRQAWMPGPSLERWLEPGTPVTARALGGTSR
jgi:isopentenyl-diphosphate delta-isomerase